MSNHDGGYRLLFSHPRMVEDLLRGFVRQPWVDGLDFATLERVNPSYISDDLKHREDDVVWRLRARGGEWMYVYLLFEFQSSVDRFMAVRVLAYVALLYQDLIRRGELTPAGTLPSIVPLVLYNGRRRWWAAREVSRLIARLPGGLDALRPRLPYLLVDEGAFSPAELAAPENVAAALFRLERSQTPSEVREIVAVLAASLPSEAESELRRAFAAWLTRVLLPDRLPDVAVPELADLREIKTMLAETVIDWTKQWKEEGLEEGRREGLQQGEARLVLRLLKRRFGPLPPDVRARVEVADADTLLVWGERVLSATTLEQVFAPVPARGRRRARPAGSS